MSNLKMLMFHKDTKFKQQGGSDSHRVSLTRPALRPALYHTNPSDFSQADVRCFCRTAPVV